MRTKDFENLEEAYNEVLNGQTRGLLKSKFFRVICDEAKNFTAAGLDQDYALSSDVWDWLTGLKKRPLEMQDFAEASLSHAMDDFQDEGIEWNEEINQQFEEFFHKILQNQDSKVWNALTQERDYTEELDQILYK